MLLNILIYVCIRSIRLIPDVPGPCSNTNPTYPCCFCFNLIRTLHLLKLIQVYQLRLRLIQVFVLPSPCLTLSRMIWFTLCCSNPTCPGRPGPLRWCLIWWGRWPSTWGGSWRRWWGRWCGYTCRCRWLACRRFVPAVGSARVGQVGEAPAGLALKCRGIISIVLQRQCAPKMQHENRIVLKRQWQI